ncbi:inositol monophosphatase family protein [soil metagenome]
MELQSFLDLGTRAAREAGDLLLERWGGPARGVDTKSTATDPVSDADRDSERLLIEIIRKERPDDGMIAEETGVEASRSGITWVLDPLDGTVNYLFDIPVWCVSIAVEDENEALVGIVFDPNRDEMFTGLRGGGARLNGSEIHVSDKDELGTALIGTGFAYVAEARELQARRLIRILPRVRDIRRAGSAALDLTSVACGRIDGLYEAPMERWDKAAGSLLVTEAGGVVSDLEGPLDLSSGVIAAGAQLHDGLRSLVLGATGAASD